MHGWGTHSQSGPSVIGERDKREGEASMLRKATAASRMPAMEKAANNAPDRGCIRRWPSDVERVQKGLH